MVSNIGSTNRTDSIIGCFDDRGIRCSSGEQVVMGKVIGVMGYGVEVRRGRRIGNPCWMMVREVREVISGTGKSPLRPR